jgi:glycogen synthase
MLMKSYSLDALPDPTLMRLVQDQIPHSILQHSILQLGMGWFPEQAGGLNRYFFGLTRSLAANGIPYRGLVAGDVTGEPCVKAFVDRSTSLPMRLLAARRSIRDELRSPTALIATHFALYAFPALDLIRRYPTVVHFHGPWADEKQKEGNRGLSLAIKVGLERLVYGSAQKVITLSESFAKVAEERYRVHRENIEVIPGGIEAETFHCNLSMVEAREKIDWPQDRIIVFCMRRLVPRMGLLNLVAAVNVIVKRIPEFMLVVGGKGPLAADMQSQIEQSNLEHHIKMAGFIPDVLLPVAYRGANMSIVPSECLEGFGLVAAESLAAGTPAMVTPVGGLPEVVRKLCPDLVMQSASPIDMAEGVVEAIQGTRVLPSPDACARYARSNFDWSVVTPRIAGVYSKAVG